VVRLAVVSHQEHRSDEGLIGALRRLRDPLLLLVAPLTFAFLLVFAAYHNLWVVGFDFRGTLWEPARAVLDGGAIYPPPTAGAVATGNPTVYPPLFILASIPLTVLPVTLAAWVWFFVLAGCVLGALWILGVRDWRCHVLAVTSLVVVHGMYFGNLTLVLVLLLAVAWRYRDRPASAGLAVGVAVAAKLFVWPLVVWFLLTRRFRAAAWALVSAALLVIGPWAVIGFDGFADYPSLLRVVQDVYSVRSLSVSTVAASLGASVDVAVAAAAVAGVVCLGAAAWFVRGVDGDRRAFAATVGACIFASSIVWPNYFALLFVPIAITWPTLAAPWFFGQVIWFLSLISPARHAEPVCCRPPDVTEQAWASSHAAPVFWFPALALGLAATVLGATLWRVRPRGVREA
jgi:hypothetical protein